MTLALAFCVTIAAAAIMGLHTIRREPPSTRPHLKISQTSARGWDETATQELEAAE